jgi:hypothetical protein
MRYTTTLILAAIVMAAGVIIYAYRDRLTGEAKPPEKPTEARALLEKVALDDIISATLEERAADGQTKATFALKKSEGQWRLAEPVDYPADAYEVDRLVRAAVDAKYRQTVEAGAKDQPALAALGLDPAAYRLVLATAAKDDAPARTITLEIGKRGAIGEGLYVRVDESPKVVVLDKADLLERAREKLDTYRSRELLALDRDEIVRISLEGAKGQAELDRSPSDRGRWIIGQPVSARADPEAVSGLTRAVLGLTVKDFIEDNPKDLARYGLAQPRLAVTLWKEGPPPEAPKPEGKAAGKTEAKSKPEPVKAVTLKFGGWADIKHDAVYLLTNDSKHVVSVDAAVLKDLAKSPSDLRDKHVLAADATRATQIAVRLPTRLATAGHDVEYTLIRDGAGWKVQAAGRPVAKADAASVEALLKELGDLRVLYFAEGDRADLAKGFSPLGSVRLTIEGEVAPQGFEISGAAGVPPLVKNVREDWIGRINEKSLTTLRQDWLDYLDRQVFAVEARDAAEVAIRTADRQIVLRKKDGPWRLAEPIEAEPDPTYLADLFKEIQNLPCDRYVAVTKDFKTYGLEPGQVTLTVTRHSSWRAKPGEKPATKTLRLAHGEKGKIVGRADDGDLVFEVAPDVFNAIAGEPLDRKMTELASPDVGRLEVTAGGTTTTLIRVDEKWYRADPKGAPADEVSADIVKPIVDAASDLAAARWAAYDAKDPARFGLERPALKIKAATEKASATILISDKEVPADLASLADQKPVRYAMTEGGPRIAVLAGRALDALLAAPKAVEPKKEEAAAPK